MEGTGPIEALAAAITVAQPTLYHGATQELSPPRSPVQSCPSPSATPPSDRISTRTRRRAVIANSNAPPDAGYGFGPGGSLRPSARLANIPPLVPRPQSTPLTAATSAPAASPVPTVPMPTDRNHAEPITTLLLRLPSTPGDTSTASTTLDALDNVNELQFA